VGGWVCVCVCVEEMGKVCVCMCVGQEEMGKVWVGVCVCMCVGQEEMGKVWVGGCGCPRLHMRAHGYVKARLAHRHVPPDQRTTGRPSRAIHPIRHRESSCASLGQGTAGGRHACAAHASPAKAADAASVPY
jgi:hypothetical protein